VLQLLVLLSAVAWVAPLMVKQLLSVGSSATAGDQASLEASETLPWVVLWFMLSLFPAFALAAMTRPRVRAAFDAAERRRAAEEEEK
jgi:hypothetical protein